MPSAARPLVPRDVLDVERTLRPLLSARTGYRSRSTSPFLEFLACCISLRATCATCIWPYQVICGAAVLPLGEAIGSCTDSRSFGSVKMRKTSDEGTVISRYDT